MITLSISISTIELPESTTVKEQKRRFNCKVPGHEFYYMEVHWDDPCGNKRNEFRIKTNVSKFAPENQRERIEKLFPGLAYIPKFEGMTARGLGQGIPNAVYLAGDRDCWGLKKGQGFVYAYAITFAGERVPHIIDSRLYGFLQKTELKPGEFKVYYVGCENTPKFHCYGEGDFKTWQCPWSSRWYAETFVKALNVGHWHLSRIPTQFSPGKERDLDAARRCACWPEATDETLCLPKKQLTRVLEEREPYLLRELYAIIKEMGMEW